MPIREAEADDGERVREVVSSAMSSAYAISPGQIEVIVEEQFGDEAMERKTGSESTLLFVATASEDEAEEDGDMSAGTVVGVAEASVDESDAELGWLFVDPEHWDLGHGTELFEAIEEGADRLDVRELRGATIVKNEQGQDFCEQFGFERVDDREAEIAGETFVEHIYARTEDADGESDPQTASPEEADEPAVEGVETEEGTDTGVTEPEVEVPDEVTTDDGTTTYLERDEPLSGIEAPFFQLFEDEAREEPYGYFCSNCGSTNVTMDNMGRIECNECGNQHRSRNGYDASYL